MSDLPALAYFEDLHAGFSTSATGYEVTEAEIIEFGQRFDQQPFHTDPVAARDSVFGGLVAPGCLTMCARSWLVNHLDTKLAYQAGLGVEEMTLPNPVRPGDVLSLRLEVVSARPSQSRPGSGVVAFTNTVFNQRGETVLTLLGKVLVQRRTAPDA